MCFFIHIIINVYTVKSFGNFQVKSGPVATPDVELCRKRAKLWEYKGHFYNIVYTSNEWLTARNICRRQCMDAVAIETQDEANMVADKITQVGVYYPWFQSVWTSGRRCDFEQCRDFRGRYLPHLLPLDINGWFWAGTQKSIPPTNLIPSNWTENPWSQFGFYGPQPDNGEFRKFYRNGEPPLNEDHIESCLAVLGSNEGNGDGVRWHDIACYHKHPVVCEDDEALIYHVQFHNPHLKIR